MISEQEGRAALVAEALSWEGTPYHHRATLKGIGVDCAQFVLKTYANVGLIEDYDTGDYPQDWHIHRDAERYMRHVLRVGAPIPLEAVQPGDVMLFKIGRVFSHGGVVIEPPVLLHAWMKAGRVCRGDWSRDSDLAEAEKLCFSYWAKTDGR